MRAILVVLALVLAPIAAQAQGYLVQGGSVTPGHAARWVTTGVLGDAGGAGGSTTQGSGYLTEIGITNTGTPACINDALISARGGYHQLCLGANALGTGLLSFQALGGAQPIPFDCNINGQFIQNCLNPTSGGGNGCIANDVAGGTGDAIVIPTLPCAQQQTLLLLTITSANATTAPTITAGGNTPQVILSVNGTPLCVGDLMPGFHATLMSNGNNWFLLNGVAVVGGSLFTVPNNAALKLITVPPNGPAYREGFLVAGDGGSAFYNYSTINCSLADNGAQVAPTVGGGCWIADMPSSGVDPRVWGAVGNGTTDDTVALQAATNATAAEGVPLLFAGDTQYLISSPIAALAFPPTLIGTNGNLPIYITSCPNGIKVNSNIDALELNSITATVRGLCIQMATAAGTRTAGSAIWAGTTSSTPGGSGQGHAIIENNTVLFPYNGIEIGARAGSLPQTNSDLVRNNAVISPSNMGIINGLYSTAASSNGTELRANIVACFAAQTTAIGIYIGDGGIYFDGANGGAFGCNIGMELFEKTGQTLGGGMFTGVLSDSSLTNGLLIDSSGGTVYLTTFANWWVATSGQVPALGPTILIKDTNLSQSVHDLSFGTGQVLGCTDQPLVQLQDDVTLISFGGSTFSVDCYPTFGAHHPVAINITSTSPLLTNITVNGGHFDNVNATAYFSRALVLNTAGDLFTVTGNDWGNTAGAAGNFEPFDFSGWTSTTRRAVIQGNLATSIQDGPAVTVAPTMVGDPAYDYWILNADSTTTVTAITNYWEGRRVTIIPTAATIFASGGSGAGKLCNSLTATTNVPISAFWNFNRDCWFLK